jgi:hypothetical protein
LTWNPIEMRSIDVWRTENGEFVEHWDELNYLELFQQIGVNPAFDLGIPRLKPANCRSNQPG